MQMPQCSVPALVTEAKNKTKTCFLLQVLQLKCVE